MVKIISIICIFMLVCIALVLLESHRECKRLRVTEYTVESERLPSEFDGYRFMLMADLHDVVYADDNKIIWDVLEQYHPDSILLAGDMLVCRPDMREKNLDMTEVVRRLTGYADCYYGLGNHEMGIKQGVRNVGDLWGKYLDGLHLEDNRALHLLDNQSVLIHRGYATIRVTGLSLDMEYYRRLSRAYPTQTVIRDLVGDVDNSYYNVLIAHNPDFFDAYVGWGADLVVSGHNHGGMVRLPGLGGVISPRLHIFPRYDYGIHKKSGSTMVVSGGMGAHSVKIRVNNRPEMVVITLKKQERMIQSD